MRATARHRIAALLVGLACNAASAGEVVGALGVDDLRGGPVAAIGLELRGDPLWANAALALGLGAAAEAGAGLWAGAGPVVLAPLAARWRLEASVMLGVHDPRGGIDLGAAFPVFRSQLGASYRMAPAWWLGFAINHKSNAGAARENPGVETLTVALARRF